MEFSVYEKNRRRLCSYDTRRATVHRLRQLSLALRIWILPVECHDCIRVNKGQFPTHLSRACSLPAELPLQLLLSVHITHAHMLRRYDYMMNPHAADYRPRMHIACNRMQRGNRWLRQPDVINVAAGEDVGGGPGRGRSQRARGEHGQRIRNRRPSGAQHLRFVRVICGTSAVAKHFIARPPDDEGG